MFLTQEPLAINTCHLLLVTWLVHTNMGNISGSMYFFLMWLHNHNLTTQSDKLTKNSSLRVISVLHADLSMIIKHHILQMDLMLVLHICIQLLKGLAQAKIIKKSVILFWLLNMTIWWRHVHRLELQKIFNFSVSHSPVRLYIATKFPYFLFLTWLTIIRNQEFRLYI